MRLQRELRFDEADLAELFLHAVVKRFRSFQLFLQRRGLHFVELFPSVLPIIRYKCGASGWERNVDVISVRVVHLSKGRRSSFGVNPESMRNPSGRSMIDPKSIWAIWVRSRVDQAVRGTNAKLIP